MKRYERHGVLAFDVLWDFHEERAPMKEFVSISSLL